MRNQLHLYLFCNRVKEVAFYGPNSEFIVSGSDDGFIYIWDRHSEGIVQWLCGDIVRAVNVLEPHPLYPILATSGCDNNVKASIRILRYFILY